MRRQLTVLLTVAIVGISGPALSLKGQQGTSTAATTKASGETEDPRVGYFVSETQEQGFVLDRTGEKGLLRFDRSTEILVLDMVPGPQGVTYLKDGLGTTILRLMPWGGATVYDADGSEGGAFALKKLASPLILSPRDERDVRRRSIEIRRALAVDFDFQVEIKFESGMNGSGPREQQKRSSREMATEASVSLPANERESDFRQGDEMRGFSETQKPGVARLSPFAGRAAGPASAGTLGDTLELASLALRRLATDELAHEVMSNRIARVMLRIGAQPGVSLEGQDLVITYVPERGVLGRPSSAEIERFLLENL